MGIVSYPDQKIKKKFGKIVSKKLQNITNNYVQNDAKPSLVKKTCNNSGEQKRKKQFYQPGHGRKVTKKHTNFLYAARKQMFLS